MVLYLDPLLHVALVHLSAQVVREGHLQDEVLLWGKLVLQLCILALFPPRVDHKTRIHLRTIILDLQCVHLLAVFLLFNRVAKNVHRCIFSTARRQTILLARLLERWLRRVCVRLQVDLVRRHLPVLDFARWLGDLVRAVAVLFEGLQATSHLMVVLIRLHNTCLRVPLVGRTLDIQNVRRLCVFLVRMVELLHGLEASNSEDGGGQHVREILVVKIARFGHDGRVVLGSSVLVVVERDGRSAQLECEDRFLTLQLHLFEL